MGDGPDEHVRMSLANARTRKSTQARVKKRTFLLVHGSTITGRKEPIGHFAALMHLLRAYFDISLFQMGVYVNYAGYAIAVPLALLISAMNLHCQHLYIAAMEEVARKGQPEQVHPSITETVIYTFEDSSKACIRKCAQLMGRFVNYCLCILQFGYSSAYLILSAKLLCAIMDFQNYRSVLLILALPCWLVSSFRTLKTLTRFNVCANILTFMSFGALIYYAIEGFGKIREREFAVRDLVIIYVGIMSFTTQAVVPISVIYWEVENPKTLTALFGPVNVSAAISVVLHFCVGLTEYFHWGEKFYYAKLMDAAKDDKAGKMLGLGVALSIMLGYSLIMYFGFEIMYPQFYKKFGPFTQTNQVMCIAKTVVIGITFFLAAISTMLETMTILSTICGILLSVILPAILELIRLHDNLTKLIIIKNVFIIVGSILAVFGGSIMYVIS